MKRIAVSLNILLIVIFVAVTVLKAQAQNSDSLKLEKESQHFTFYATHNDVKILDSLANALENNYSGITSHLRTHIDKKINVKIYPDIKSFHVAINYPDAPDWYVGICSGEGLLMVSPLNPGSIHTYESLLQVIIHEFTHMAVFYARGDKGYAGLPRWLSEGYAQYEAGQINDKIRRSAEYSLAADTTITWTHINSVSDIEFGRMNGYALSVSIVDFMIATYGIDKLVQLIKEPENIESIYGLAEPTLEEQWLQYMKQYHL